MKTVILHLSPWLLEHPSVQGGNCPQNTHQFQLFMMHEMWENIAGWMPGETAHVIMHIARQVKVLLTVLTNGEAGSSWFHIMPVAWSHPWCWVKRYDQLRRFNGLTWVWCRTYRWNMYRISFRLLKSFPSLLWEIGRLQCDKIHDQPCRLLQNSCLVATAGGKKKTSKKKLSASVRRPLHLVFLSRIYSRQFLERQDLQDRKRIYIDI